MTGFNVIAQLTDRYSNDLAERLVDELVDYHPAAARGPYGHPEVILTIQAEHLRQAIVTALAVVHAAGHDTYSLEVLPTEAFDRRLELEPMPELLSVTEAAERLGVSRQAVQQRIDNGTLAARRVGKTYAVPAAGLAALEERIVRQAVESGALNLNESSLDRTLRQARDFLAEGGQS